MYSKSKNPRRIFIGAIQQHVEEESCIPPEYQACDPLSFCPKDNIRVRKWPPSKARGPTFGRFVAGLLYRTEKYYMMIDSHNRFVQDWDRLSITMFMHIPGERKVVSHYPNPYEEGKPVDLGHMMVMCFVQWIAEFDITKNQAQVMSVTGHARLQPFTAAGFLFTDAETIHRVPFDPYLDYLFDGEEVLFSVRLWTHGYDLYCPSQPILFHSYDRHKAPRFWHEKGNNWGAEQVISQQRLKKMMQLRNKQGKLHVANEMKLHPRALKEFDRYGLGKERTMDQFWAFAQIDPVKQTNGVSYCSQLPP